MSFAEPGTIEQLVADAAGDGYPATPRMIRDWTQAGLLDYPHKRPAGKGHGSRPALYNARQRKLFVTLLSKRGEAGGISSLARVPVWLWLYWGDDYVPTRQAQRAFATWLGDARASKLRARTVATKVLGQLAHPHSTSQSRRELLAELTNIAYTGRLDTERLEDAVRAVFKPGHRHIRRAVGHPDAPLTTRTVIDLIRARVTAVQRLNAGEITDDDLRRARQAHLFHFAEYVARQPLLAAESPDHPTGLYEPASAEDSLNECCNHLLTVIGLQIVYP